MPPRYPYGCSPLGQVPYSAGLYATAIHDSDVYALGTVDVRLLSHTASCFNELTFTSSGGKVPVSALRFRSSIDSAAKPTVLLGNSVQFIGRPLGGCRNKACARALADGPRAEHAAMRRRAHHAAGILPVSALLVRLTVVAVRSSRSCNGSVPLSPSPSSSSCCTPAPAYAEPPLHDCHAPAANVPSWQFAATPVQL